MFAFERDFAKQVKALRNEALEYQKLRQKLIKDSNNRFVRAQKELITKLNPILAEYSQDNNISLILPKKNVKNIKVN